MQKKMIPDISHHDPVTNWKIVKNNCEFLIMKATEGVEFIDPTLYSNISYCEKYQMPYWVYTFLKKGNELKQAKFMVSTCKKQVGKYFIGYILDVERNNDKSDIKEALDWLNKQGYKTMLYTQYYQYSKYKDVIQNRGANCAWWEPRYGKDNGVYNPKYPCHDGVDLHQYTEKGKVDGIKGSVDLNRISGKKVLNWFITPLKGIDSKVDNKPVQSDIQKESYNDIFPTLPPRGYYTKNDGMTSLKNYSTQIKRIQRLVNWVDDSTKDIVIDGQFGQKTENKVKVTQKILGVPVSGKFDQATLKAAKAFKK